MTVAMTAPNDQLSPVRGTEIRRLRQEKGLGQQQLATFAGIGMTTLIRAERGEPGISYRNIVKIARALEVAPSAIYSDAPEGADLASDAIAAPAWALQQHEQVATAIADLRVMLEQLQESLKSIDHAISRGMGQ